jgi:predicted nuclease of predicted toxin-antitoxin system
VKSLLDESVDMRVALHLRPLGHDVTGIAGDYPASLPDDEVLAIAVLETRTLMTHDRDFGRLDFVEHQPHAGVILLRLGPRPRLNTTISRLTRVLTDHAQELSEFVVLTRDRIRGCREAIPSP